MSRWALVLVPLVFGATSEASYVISASSNGASTAFVEPGQVIDLDVVLTTDTAEHHTSAIFRIEFSTSGLLYEAYDWNEPYESGPGAFLDDSDPYWSALPLVLFEDTLVGPKYPQHVIDVELSNVIIGGAFSEGILATLSLRVPDTFGPDQSVEVVVKPDTFADGARVIETLEGDPFFIHVVPEPATLVLVAAAVVGGVLRRRRNCVG